MIFSCFILTECERLVMNKSGIIIGIILDLMK